MITYAIIVSILIVLSVAIDIGQIAELLLLLPIFGRIFGWW